MQVSFSWVSEPHKEREQLRYLERPIIYFFLSKPNYWTAATSHWKRPDKDTPWWGHSLPCVTESYKRPLVLSQAHLSPDVHNLATGHRCLQAHQPLECLHVSTHLLQVRPSISCLWVNILSWFSFASKTIIIPSLCALERTTAWSQELSLLSLLTLESCDFQGIYMLMELQNVSVSTPQTLIYNSGKCMNHWVNVYCWHGSGHIKNTSVSDPWERQNLPQVRLGEVAKPSCGTRRTVDEQLTSMCQNY